MKYSDFLNAARKHQAACEVIKNEIVSIDMNRTPHLRAKQRKLLLNFYYLTGYVIECSVKYGIYKLIDFDPKAPVNSLDQCGLSYNHNIKHHRFCKYADHLVSRMSGIKLIDDVNGVSREVQELYNRWDAEVRYWYSDIDRALMDKLNQRNLFGLYDCAEIVLSSVSRL